MMANATNSVKLREIMADKEAAEKQLEEKNGSLGVSE